MISKERLKFLIDKTIKTDEMQELLKYLIERECLSYPENEYKASCKIARINVLMELKQLKEAK